MASSKKVITREEWEKSLNNVTIRKEDLNKLVMNFLVTEGYVDAAEKFRMESGTESDIDLATITDRMAVKRAVQCGNVEDAIKKVNDLNPEILDTNPQLFFHLQQQRLIELIRNGKVAEALEFAQEELAPRGEENKSFLEELERTVALLAFDDVKNCPFGDLLDISQRLKTASEVNAAILTSQSHEKDPKLPSLLKMLIWAQHIFDEKAANGGNFQKRQPRMEQSRLRMKDIPEEKQLTEGEAEGSDDEDAENEDAPPSASVAQQFAELRMEQQQLLDGQREIREVLHRLSDEMHAFQVESRDHMRYTVACWQYLMGGQHGPPPVYPPPRDLPPPS